MSNSTRKKWLRRKHRIARRLRLRNFAATATPVLTAANIHYDMADRTRAFVCGGIGSVQLLARNVGLIDAIDSKLHLFKVHLPYHESDHVLSIAYNALCGGTCLQDLELLRNDEAYLDALGASRIPDPTTAGDFCRRFASADDVNTLQEAINDVRLKVWKSQPPEFFGQAILDADGTIAATDACCKQGVDISYNGLWSCHPLVISLANTKEPLYLLNRPGNRPSHEDAAEYLERSIVLCREAGFRSVLMRGDTDFSQTAFLDGWDDLRTDDQRYVTFLFGIDAMPNLKALAGAIPETDWQELSRPPRYDVKTEPRTKPQDVKAKVIAERGYKHLRLAAEHVAEIDYQPVACKRKYRLIISRKTIDVESGQTKLWQEYRYFFHITNDRETPVRDLVLSANKRCDQENLIEQLKNGVHAMRLPVNTLESNWASPCRNYRNLAWSLKAWWGLMLPPATGPGRAGDAKAKQARVTQKDQIVRMEFKRFVAGVIRLPCQIIKGGRRLVYRLLSYSPWQDPLLAAVTAWRTRRLC